MGHDDGGGVARDALRAQRRRPGAVHGPRPHPRGRAAAEDLQRAGAFPHQGIHRLDRALMARFADIFLNWEVMAQYAPKIVEGFFVTIHLAALVVVTGIAVGLALAVV